MKPQLKLRPGKINVKLLVVILVVVVALGVAALAARHIRRQILSERALSAGKAALAAENWSEACK